MLRKLFSSVVISVFCLLVSVHSHADWLTDSLSVVANPSGIYKGPAGSTVSGGSVRVRIGHTRVQPISITPMSVSGGCNGIDVHLGGFSFISGDEILVMLKTIAQGVVSQAFYIAITQGCPICSKAIEISQDLANFANKLSIDTCQVSTDMANWGAAKISDMRSGACSAKDSETNNTGSFLASMSDKNSACNTKQGAKDILKELQKSCDSGSAEEKASCKADNMGLMHLAGVSTYEYLVAMGAVNPGSDLDMMYMEMYISMVGTYVNGVKLPGILTAIDMIDLIDCGIYEANDGSHDKDTKEWCSPWWDSLAVSNGSSEKSVYKCVAGPGVNSKQSSCAKIVTTPIREYIDGLSDSTISKTPFSLNGTSASLMRVINTAQGKIDSDTGSLSPGEVGMIGRAPFPLYRLLNLSPYYPGLVDSLIGDSIKWLSAEIATSQASDFSNKLASISGKIELTDSTDSPAAISEEVVDALQHGADTFTLQKSEYRAARELQREAIDSITRKIASLERVLIQDNIQTLIGGASR